MKAHFQSINPTTGTLLSSFPSAEALEIKTSISTGHDAFLKYKEISLERRKIYLEKAAKRLTERKQKIAKLMAEEMGKPIAEGISEVEKCALVCSYYAENGADFLKDEIRVTRKGTQGLVKKYPLGVVLAVMPWNFPCWQIFRIAAPLLMSGNAVLVKPAPNTPQCALEIENIFKKIGLPAGMFQILFATHSGVESIIADSRIRGVTLTGSSKAGSIVASLAGKYLKPSVMELGGSDPFIICQDADLQEALKAGITSRTINNGQSCIAAKRFIVHESHYEKFLTETVGQLLKLRVGNPKLKSTNLGPLATKKQQRELHDIIIDAKKAGAKILCGGSIPKQIGNFYPPTVVTNISKKMRISTEETFGPIFSVYKFKRAEDALVIANQTDYGLGASVWTKSKRKADFFTTHLDCGSVFVNDFVRSDPRLPFGGTKNSGYGRELSKEGACSFINVKTVWSKAE